MNLRVHSLRLPLRGIATAALVLGLLTLVPLYSSAQIGQLTAVNVLATFTANAPIALAAGLVIILGEFDLSVVAVYALGSMTALSMQNDLVFRLVAVAVIGAGIGAFQGLLVARLKIAAVPVTLGVMLAVSGLVSALSDGTTVVVDDFKVTLWLITPIVWIFTPAFLMVLGVFAVLASILALTRLGVDMRAVGGDRVASQVSGVRVATTTVATFALAGLIASLGGALSGFSSGAALPDVSFAPLITAITALVIGGLALNGGEGHLGNILVGVLTMAMLAEVFAIGGANPNVITILTGLFLIAVAVLNPTFRDWMTVRRLMLSRR